MANKIFKGLKFPGMDDYYVLPEAVITKNEDGIIEIESCLTGTTEIENLDTTLTREGYAADAKAVGEAINNIAIYTSEEENNSTTIPLNADTLGGRNADDYALDTDINNLQTQIDSKAPAGYGLGEQDSKHLSSTDDLNSANRNGFYSWALPPSNAPFSNGIMIVATYDWARKVQYILSAENGCAVQRIQYGNSWREFEWVNPPMNIGVEYRTTERYMGYPVYTMCFDAGTGPASGTANIPIPATAAGNLKIVDARVKAVDAEGWGGFISKVSIGEYPASRTIAISEAGDISTTTMYVTVKYYKV